MMKKAKAIEGCATHDGKVYAFMAAPTPNTRDTRFLIDSQEKLATFCLEYVKKPIDNFLEAWQK